jgi:hypothetical protein
MAAFTQMIKSKPKKVSNGPEGTATRPDSKLKSRYSYMNSTMKKPKIKAVKHQEIMLNQEDNPPSK